MIRQKSAIVSGRQMKTRTEIGSCLGGPAASPRPALRRTETGSPWLGFKACGGAKSWTTSPMGSRGCCGRFLGSRSCATVSASIGASALLLGILLLPTPCPSALALQPSQEVFGIPPSGQTVESVPGSCAPRLCQQLPIGTPAHSPV